MKKKVFYTAMLLASLTFSVTSCCDGGDITNETPTSPEQPAEEPQRFFSTTDVPEGYNTGVVNERNNNLYFIADENGNGTGNVKRVNFVLNNGGEDAGNGVAIFSGNRMRSMTINGVTYTFSQNADNKVDVAVTRNNVTELYTNVADASLIDLADSNNKLAAAFLGIGNTADIIKDVNGLISDNSALYEYISSLQKYLDSLKGDSEWLGDNDNAGSLAGNTTGKELDYDKDVVKNTDSEADNNTNSGNGAVVSGKGKLKATLTWFFPSDIDLHVYEPDYTYEVGHIYYSTPTNSFTDGYLDIDNRVGYYINPVTNERNESLAAVENIYWKESPKDGVYKLCLDNYSERRGGICNLSIYKDGRSIYNQDVDLDTNDRMRYIVSVRMPQGEVFVEDGTDTRSGEGVDAYSLPKKDFSAFRVF